MNPINKYNTRAKKINSLLCIGLDSDFEKLPKKFLKLKYPQFEFNKWIIEETHEYTAAYKMNSAFYEARGVEGIKELKITIDYLNKNYPDIFTILDAKRADIGNTNESYISAIFDWLNFDAVTVHPYLGQEAIQPFLDRKDKVSIVLCKTSNKGAGEFQDLEISENGNKKKLWQIVAENVSLGHSSAIGEAKKWNKNNNCMLVVGATYPEEMKKIRKITGDMTFLVPGIGIQGGDLRVVMKVGLNSAGLGLIINSSRDIIFSENPRLEAQKLRDGIRGYKNT